MKKFLIMFLVGCLMFGIPGVVFGADNSDSLKSQVKTVNADGSIPQEWNMEKPSFEPHPDIRPDLYEEYLKTSTRSKDAEILRGGNGDGENSISFSLFDDGDIIVTQEVGTFGHAGVYDATLYEDLSSYAIWSANMEPEDGVQLEKGSKYRNYDEAFALWVPDLTSSKRTIAREYCEAQEGDPYDLSPKSDWTSWYCSKLAWGGYYWTANCDLDGDGGIYVYPEDLIGDDDTSQFAYSD